MDDQESNGNEGDFCSSVLPCRECLQCENSACAVGDLPSCLDNLDVVITPPGPVIMPVGGTRRLTSVGGPLAGTYAWSVSDPGVIGIQGSSTARNITIEGLSAGTATVTVSFTAGGKTVTDSVEVTVVEAILKNITFNSDHGVLKDNTTTWDDTGTLYSEPEWQNLPARNYPITHSRTSNIIVTVEIELLPITMGAQNYTLTGNATFLYLNFSRTGTIGGGLNQITMTSAGLLPNSVQSIPGQSIEWELIWNGLTFNIGNSTGHKIYVTYDSPIPFSTQGANDVTEKRISNVIQWVSGATTMDNVAQGVWNYLTYNEPPVFQLGVPCPPDVWTLMAGGSANNGECIALALLMEKTTEIIGVPASIGYIYATTDNNNFSASPTAWETRLYEYAPGLFRTEILLYYAGGGWNNWEAVAEVNSRYYAVKEVQGDNAVDIIRTILGANDPNVGNYQCWIYQDIQGDLQCNTEDQYPAPLP